MSNVIGNVIPIVRKEEAQLALDIETKLLSLPEDSGILFVGVLVHPYTDRPPLYHITIGCSRKFDEKLYDPLVRVTLGKMAEGIEIRVFARRGIARGSIPSLGSYIPQSS